MGLFPIELKTQRKVGSKKEKSSWERERKRKLISKSIVLDNNKIYGNIWFIKDYS